jgi:hypothetical protein
MTEKIRAVEQRESTTFVSVAVMTKSGFLSSSVKE